MGASPTAEGRLSQRTRCRCSRAQLAALAVLSERHRSSRYRSTPLKQDRHGKSAGSRRARVRTSRPRVFGSCASPEAACAHKKAPPCGAFSYRSQDLNLRFRVGETGPKRRLQRGLRVSWCGRVCGLRNLIRASLLVLLRDDEACQAGVPRDSSRWDADFAQMFEQGASRSALSAGAQGSAEICGSLRFASHS